MFVDAEKTNVYDQEYHAKYGTTNGEPVMKLSEYLKVVDKLRKLNDETSYIYWKDLHKPEIHSYPFKNEHLEDSRYIIQVEMLGRSIHEIRVLKDYIPFSDLQVVHDAPIVR